MLDAIIDFIAANATAVKATLGIVAVAIARFTAAWPYVRRVGVSIHQFATAPARTARTVEAMKADNVQYRASLTAILNALSDKVSTIEKEVRTNGGSTIKDATLELADACHLIQAKTNFLFNRTDTPHFELSPITGELVFANSTMCDMLDLSPGDATGWGWLRAFHPEEQTSVWTKLQDCIHQDAPYAGRYRLVCSHTGQVRMVVDVTTTAIRSPKTRKVLTIWGEMKSVRE